MSNGSNEWGVEFHRIQWFGNLLSSHNNVASVSRTRDILFQIERVRQRDSLRALCLYEYTASRTAIINAINYFGNLDIIHIGGGWCGYTKQAKQYCLENSIGLYVSDEMTGALWKNDFWNYNKTDKDGNPIYFVRQP